MFSRKNPKAFVIKCKSRTIATVRHLHYLLQRKFSGCQLSLIKDPNVNLNLKWCAQSTCKLSAEGKLATEETEHMQNIEYPVWGLICVIPQVYFRDSDCKTACYIQMRLLERMHLLIYYCFISCSRLFKLKLYCFVFTVLHLVLSPNYIFCSIWDLDKQKHLND